MTIIVNLINCNHFNRLEFDFKLILGQSSFKNLKREYGMWSMGISMMVQELSSKCPFVSIL